MRAGNPELGAADYVAIQNLLYRYCDYLDRGDLEGMAALFAHADFFVPERSEPIRCNPAEIATLYRSYVRIYPDTRTPKTRHVTTNALIEAESHDSVRVQSYVIVFQATEGFSMQPVIGGRNYDRIERVAGGWRFSERRIESDLFGDLRAHLLQPFGPTSARG
jgi:3-phenylpropionate/cinnamic acid dioxygenase small subunit